MNFLKVITFIVVSFTTGLSSANICEQYTLYSPVNSISNTLASSGRLSLGWNSKVLGSTNLINTSNITPIYSALSACNNGQCIITNSILAPLSLPDFITNNSIINLKFDEDAEISLNTLSNSIDTLTINSNNKLTILSDATRVSINNLTLLDGAEIHLPEGEFWIENLTTYSSAKITVSDGTKLFTKNTNIAWASTINEDKNDFVWVSYSSLLLPSSAFISGYIYSNNELRLGYNSTVEGIVIAENITMSSSSTIRQFQSSHLDSLFYETCETIENKNDFDGDGIVDSFDDDIDNDGFSNDTETKHNTDPFNALSFPLDKNNNSIPDIEEEFLVTSCPFVFETGVQSNESTGSVQFGWNAQLSGLITQNPINTTLLTQFNSNLQTCNDYTCYLSGIESIHLENLSFEPNFPNIIELGDINSIEIPNLKNKSGHLSIKSLVISANTEISIESGSYFIDTLIIENGAELKTIGGTVRLYVKNNINVANNAKLNVDREESDLFIAARDNVSFSQGSETNAFIYSLSTVTLIDSILNGSISAKHANIGYNSKVNFDRSSIYNVDFAHHCDIDLDGVYDLFDSDKDGDGFDNESEVDQNTDPEDATDYPDIIAPILKLEGSSFEFTSNTNFELSGFASDEYSGLKSIKIIRDDGYDAEIYYVNTDSQGKFSFRISLIEGINEITVIAEDSWGNSINANKSIHLDQTAPVVTFTSLFSPTNNTKFTISGFITDIGGYRDTDQVASFLINNKTVELYNNQFTYQISLKEGNNVFNWSANDQLGNNANGDFTILKDATAPIIDWAALETPSDNAAQTVSASISDALSKIDSVSLSIDGISSALTLANGAVSTDITLTEGSHELTLSAVDALANTSTETQTILIDLTAPIVVLDSLSNLTNDSNYTVSGSVSDEISGLASLTITHNENELITVSVSENTFTQAFTLVEGENTFTIIATDNVGRKTTETHTVNSDFTAPVIVIDNTELAFVADQTYVITGSVSDENSGIESLNVDYNETTSAVTVSADGSFTTTVVLTEVDKTHSIEFTATDTSGNSDSVSHQVQLDSTAPIVTFNAFDTATSASEIIITGTVVDAGIGLVDSVLTIANSVVSIESDGTFTTTIALNEGENTVAWTVKDSLNNSAAGEFSILKDATAPVIDWAALATPNDSASQTVSANISDALSNIDSVSLSVDGASSALTLLNGAVTTDLTLSEGSHELTITAVDVLANTSSESQTILIDLTAPVVVLDSLSNLTNDSNFTISGSASDAISGLAPLTITHNENVAVTVSVDENLFSKAFALVEGENTFTVLATDNVGRTTTVLHTINSDFTSPVIVIDNTELAFVADQTYMITGSVSDENSGIDSLIINYNEVVSAVTVAEDGSFTATISLTDEDKTHSVEFTATDTSGNSDSVSHQVQLDSTAPILTFNAFDTATSALEITISGSIVDTGFGLVDSVLTIANSIVSINSDGTFTTTVLLTEGSNTIAWSVKDSLNNSDSGEFSILKDASAPVIDWAALATPSDSAEQTVSANISDGLSNIDAVSLSVDGSVSELTLSNGTVLTEISLTEGSHELTITAVDALANSSSETQTILIDLTSPIVTLDALSVLTNDSNFTVSGSASDAISGLASLTIKHNNNIAISVSVTDNNFSQDFTLPEGENTFTLLATDKVGRTTSVVHTINSDFTAPVITVDNTELAFVAEQTYVITGSVSDENSGIESLTVNYNEVVSAVTVAENGSFTTTISLIDEDKIHSIEFTAKDTSGNSDSESHQVQLDTTAPVVTFNSVDAATSASELTITGSVSDAGIGLVDSVLMIASTVVSIESDGSFNTSISLTEGTNSIVWSVKDSLNNSDAGEFSILKDATAPVIDWAALATPSDSAAQTVSANISDALSNIDAVSLSVDGSVSELTLKNGSVSTEISLTEGSHELTLSAVDALANSSSETQTILIDLTAPIVNLDALSVLTNDSNFTVSGSASDDISGLASLTITHNENSEATISVTENLFSQGFTLLEGENTFTVLATDNVGRTTSVVHTVNSDFTAPVITVDNTELAFVADQTYIITGSVSDENSGIDSLTVNYNETTSAVTVSADGSFTTTVALTEADKTHSIVFTATDTSGNSDSVTHQVQLDTSAPVVNFNTFDAATAETEISISGTVVDTGIGLVDSVLTIANSVVSIESDGSFTTSISLTEGTNIIVWTVKDSLNNSDSGEFSILKDATAPVIDWAALATPSDSAVQTVSANFSDALSNIDAVSLSVDGSVSELTLSNGSVSTEISLTEGSHELTISAVDTLANSSSETQTILIDLTAPIVTLDALSNLTNDSSFTVSGSANDAISGLASLTIKHNDNAAISVSVTDNNFSQNFTLLEGSNTFTVLATDNVGRTTSDVHTINSDFTAPVIVIENSELAFVTDQTYVITGSVSDENSGIESLTVNYNEVVSSVTVAEDGSFTTTISLTDEDKTHSIEFTAKDTSGNSDSVTHQVQLDSTAPIVTFNAFDTATPASEVTITGSVSDAGIGLVDSILTIANTVVSIESDGSFTTSISLTEGTNSIAWSVKDSLNNSDAGEFSILKDATAPVIDWAALATPSDSAVQTVSANISDALSNIDAVSLSVDGSVSELTLSNGSVSTEISLTEGSHELTISAVDALANSSSETQTILIDLTAPIVVLDTLSTLTNDSNITVSGSANDAVSGLALLTIKHNDNTAISVSVTDNNFSQNFVLLEGSNTFTVLATDNVGRTTSVVHSVNSDFTAPVITLTPQLSNLTKETSITIFGSINDAASLQVDVNGTVINLDENGEFTYTTDLALNALNSFTVKATDTAGNISQEVVELIQDSIKPELNITTELSDTSNPQWAINLESLDDNGINSIKLILNGSDLITVDSAALSHSITLTEGENTLEAVVLDNAGNQTSNTISKRLDSTAPVITLDIALPTQTNLTSLQLQGFITEQGNVTVAINSQLQTLTLDDSHQFNQTVTLSEGNNQLVITAIDSLQNSTSQTFDVFVDSTAPTIDLSSVPSLVDNELFDLIAVISDVSAITSSKVLLNQSVVTSSLNGSNLVSSMNLNIGINTIDIEVTDALGNKATASTTIELENDFASLEIVSPSNASRVDQNTVTVTGSIESEIAMSELTLTFAGTQVDLIKFSSQGSVFTYSFSYDWSLTDGDNIALVELTSATDKTSIDYNLFYSSQPAEYSKPALTILTPANNAFVSEQSITVKGEIYSDSPSLTLTQDGSPINIIGSQGYWFFESTIELNNQSSSQTIFSATDAIGQTDNQIINLFSDATPPSITLFDGLKIAPEINLINANQTTISGSITEGMLASFTINGQNVDAFSDGNGSYVFAQDIALSNTPSELVLVASDISGNSDSMTVILQSTAQASLEFIFPQADSAFINDNGTTIIDVLLQSSDAPSSATVTLNLNELNADGSQTQVASYSINNQNQYYAQQIPMPAVGNYQLSATLLSASQAALSNVVVELNIEDEEMIELAVTAQYPTDRADWIEPNDALSFSFNKEVTSENLNIEVFETFNGETWVNLDAPGTDTINAQGHQLVDIQRNYEPVGGTISITADGRNVQFLPNRELAYGAQMFITITNLGEEILRTTFNTRALPTIINGTVSDQFRQPLENLEVSIKGTDLITYTDDRGNFIFGISEDKTKQVPSGKQIIQINKGMKSPSYGDVNVYSDVIDGIKQRHIKQIVPRLNDKFGMYPIEQGKTFNAINGDIKIDLSKSKLKFDDGRNKGLVHYQFNIAGSLDTQIMPVALPLWVYSANPKGIEIDENAIFDLNTPTLKDAGDHLPANGNYVVMVGVDPDTNIMVPLGFGQIDNRRIKVNNHNFKVLDHIGFAIMPAHLQEFINQQAQSPFNQRLFISLLISEAEKTFKESN